MTAPIDRALAQAEVLRKLRKTQDAMAAKKLAAINKAEDVSWETPDLACDLGAE
jgi:hypothetical protein